MHERPQCTALQHTAAHHCLHNNKYGQSHNQAEAATCNKLILHGHKQGLATYTFCWLAPAAHITLPPHTPCDPYNLASSALPMQGYMAVSIAQVPSMLQTNSTSLPSCCNEHFLGSQGTSKIPPAQRGTRHTAANHFPTEAVKDKPAYAAAPLPLRTAAKVLAMESMKVSVSS